MPPITRSLCKFTVGQVSDVKKKLKSLKSFLREWNKDQFGNFDEQIKQEVSTIAEVYLANEICDLMENETLLGSQSFGKLWKLLNRRESCWKQKSRIDKFRFGDANTKYFHRSATFRKRRNVIKGLTINGAWSENPNSVKDEAVHYFRQRFTPTDIPQVHFPIEPQSTLSDSDNTWLTRAFLIEEIKKAIWDCSSDKARGPDGCNLHIIKTLWESMVDDIKLFMDESHSHGKLVKGLTTSFIVLVPKKENPLCLDDYRPISLIISLYKIVAKCLANRLKPIMGKIISPSQAAFIGAEIYPRASWLAQK